MELQICKANIPNGFSVKLSDVAAKQIYVWCYEHVLNLVISDITLKVLKSITLFGILNGCAVFIWKSHTRMDIWTTINSKKKRICTIGETKWWFRDASLIKIFVNFNNPESGVFEEIILTLTEIETGLKQV